MAGEDGEAPRYEVRCEKCETKLCEGDGRNVVFIVCTACVQRMLWEVFGVDRRKRQRRRLPRVGPWTVRRDRRRRDRRL
jgi:hypothetical protein